MINTAERIVNKNKNNTLKSLKDHHILTISVLIFLCVLRSMIFLYWYTPESFPNQPATLPPPSSFLPSQTLKQTEKKRTEKQASYKGSFFVAFECSNASASYQITQFLASHKEHIAAATQNAIPLNVSSFCGLKGCLAVLVMVTVDVCFQMIVESLFRGRCFPVVSRVVTLQVFLSTVCGDKRDRRRRRRS